MYCLIGKVDLCCSSFTTEQCKVDLASCETEICERDRNYLSNQGRIRDSVVDEIVLT